MRAIAVCKRRERYRDKEQKRLVEGKIKMWQIDITKYVFEVNEILLLQFSIGK